MPEGYSFNWLKLIILAPFALYAYHCASPEWHFIDGVNVLFHEAGHPIFGIFGNDFLAALGGTLGQLIMPLVIMGNFIWTGQRLSVAIAGLWFAENFFGIARYIQDATMLELPLVGNGDRLHDWNYMLTELGILSWDMRIGNVVHMTGMVILLISVAVGVWFCFEKQEVDAV